ncbi:MAG TPA: ArsA-related P-loop ATPase [Streptosporangiaceae bacterium]
MTSRDTDWDGVRLHVVTGKGGTGKTTVAAALALALAAGGRKVLLIEVEGRQGIARLFDAPPLPYDERKIALGLGARGEGGDVYALAVDPEGALLDYLAMFYNLRRAGTALTKLGVVDFATTIAPGLSDVLVTGKATEAARRRVRPGAKDSPHVYHAVVMDAPPTGRIGRFLNISAAVSDLAKVGPIRTHSDTVAKVIRSPQTAVHFITTLEEMPVQETLDGLAELRSLTGGAIAAGGIFVNMVRQTMLDPADLEAAAEGSLDIQTLATGLKGAGISDNHGLAADLATELREHALQAKLQDRARSLLDAAGRPRYELPMLPDGVDLAGLYQLATAMREQGAA